MLFSTRLAAVDPGRNIRRSYLIRCARDLLGDIILDVERGRLGSWSVARREVFTDDITARRRVRQLLTRRRSARRRLGVGYEVIEQQGMDWLARGRT